ncbi:MAG: hypothetical protein ACE5G5_09955, partial [Candidatus Methylomirabilales bacterium]
ARLEEIRAMLEDVRIDAEPVVVDEADNEMLIEQSRNASIVFLPFTIYGGRFYHSFGGEVPDVLPELPIVVLSLAAHDVDLSAEPEEGEQAEIASALDRLEDTKRRLEKLEAEAQRAAKAAEDTSAELSTMVQERAEADALAQKRAEVHKAQEAAQKSARRASRAAASKERAEKHAAELGTDVNNHDQS